jgi:GNAT superfamily N-acetyltransferase
MGQKEALAVRLRPASERDEAFLLAVYRSTREDDLAVLPGDDMAGDAFVAQQRDAQTRSYAARHPDAEHSIVLVHDRPAGRLVVDRTATGITLLDVALLPPFRGRGIGAELVTRLQAEAASMGLPVRLHVLVSSPARRLYERLGFRAVVPEGIHLLMEWRAR